MVDSSHIIAGEGPGVLIVGTEAGCGKTVLMCALAGALREQQYKAHVLKPVFLMSRKAAEAEIAYITTVGQSAPNYPMNFLERPTNMRETNWHNAVLVSRNADQVNFIEMPGGCASPVCYQETQAGTLSNVWRDTSDLALEFQRPCILVAKHQGDALEKLVLGASYLQAQGLSVCALATVEVVQNGGSELENKTTRGDFSMGLFGRTNVPFLGCLKFSPSISVPRVSQGNLIKQTAGLDFMILLRALNLSVPAGEMSDF